VNIAPTQEILPSAWAESVQPTLQHLMAPTVLGLDGLWILLVPLKYLSILRHKISHLPVRSPSNLDDHLGRWNRLIWLGVEV
jgi:hypothetical protein